MFVHVFFIVATVCGRRWRRLTVLPDVHTDGLRRGDVSIRRLHGSAGTPHVKEKEHGDRRKAEDGEEGQKQDVGQEHELETEERRQNISYRANQ